MGVINWNGVSSDTLGVFVERYPNYSGTARRYETITVAGRNGSLLFDLGGYENIVQEYDIAIMGNGPDAARTVRQWLLGTVGYARLIDSYDPLYYRNAYFEGPLNIENVLNAAGRATIRFVCGPERYLISGDSYINVPNAGTTEITNPYNTVALPFFRITKTAGQSGDIELSAANASAGGWASYIELDTWTGTTAYISSELRDVYQITSGSMNNKVDLTGGDGFPRVDPNDTLQIYWSGNVTKVEIKPNWWSL